MLRVRNEEVETAVPYFHTKAEIILHATDVNEFYENAVAKIKECIDKCQK